MYLGHFGRNIHIEGEVVCFCVVIAFDLYAYLRV